MYLVRIAPSNLFSFYFRSSSFPLILLRLSLFLPFPPSLSLSLFFFFFFFFYSFFDQLSFYLGFSLSFSLSLSIYLSSLFSLFYSHFSPFTIICLSSQFSFLSYTLIFLFFLLHTHTHTHTLSLSLSLTHTLSLCPNFYFHLFFVSFTPVPLFSFLILSHWSFLFGHCFVSAVFNQLTFLSFL